MACTFIDEMAAATKDDPLRTAAFIHKGLDVLPDVCTQSFKAGLDLVLALAEVSKKDWVYAESFINKSLDIMPALVAHDCAIARRLIDALGDVAKSDKSLATLFINKGFDIAADPEVQRHSIFPLTYAVMELTQGDSVLASTAIDRGLGLIPSMAVQFPDAAKDLVHGLLVVARKDAPTRTVDVIVSGFDVVPSIAAQKIDHLACRSSWREAPLTNGDYVDTFVSDLHRAAEDDPDKAAAFVHKGFDVLPAVVAADGGSACRLLHHLAEISEGNPALASAFIDRGLDVVPNIAGLYPVAASVLVRNLTEKAGLDQDRVVCREFMRTESLRLGGEAVTVVFGDTPETTRATAGLGFIQGGLSEFKKEADRQTSPDSSQRQEYDRILADVFNVQGKRDSLPSFRDLAKGGQQKVSLHP